MSLDSFLRDMRHRGVKLWVEGDRLRYQAPRSALSEDLLGELKRRKSGIIERLKHEVEARERRRGEGLHPMAAGQRALWFVSRLDPVSPAYNYAFSGVIRSRIDAAGLREAFQSVVQRHSALRTTYVIRDGEPMQRVHAAADVPFREIDAAGWSGERLEREVERSTREPFDLERGPLARVDLFSRGPEEHHLLLNAHHSVMDFRSLVVVLEELTAFYEAATGTGAATLPEAVQYTDYARWLGELCESPEAQRQLAYWEKELAGDIPPLNLPLDRSRPAVQTYNGASCSFGVSDSLTDGLRRLARDEGVTLYSVLLAAFQVLLHRYSGQDDVLIGSPMLGRTRPEFQRVVGYCINPVVLRGDVSDNPTFLELLRRTHGKVLAALEHQDYPFPLLVQHLQPRRDPSRSPLFDVMFNLNSADVPETAGATGPHHGGSDGSPALVIEPQIRSQGEGQFDLILQVFDSGRDLACCLEFNSDLFDASTMERMGGHFEALLQGIVDMPRRPISALPLLTKAEREQFTKCHGAASDYPADTCLHTWFERQVEHTPDAVAVVFGEERLTYGELNRRANRLAHRLRRLGVEPETLVGLYVERSLDTVLGILAVLKAGGAYLPIDTAYPPKRVEFMLADSGASILLTQTALADKLPAKGVRVVCLDDERNAGAPDDERNPESLATPENAAYVIYTSGSTGTPKGAVICHRNVVRLFTATEAWFAFDSRDVWTLFHSAAFDFSVWELWGALLYGARLVVVPREISRAPRAFHDLCRREGVTVLNQTPSAFRNFADVDAATAAAERWTGRLVIFGGEALDLQSLQPWFKRHAPDAPRLVNMYGITETTVHVTYRPIGPEDAEHPRGSLIGRPIPDLELHVLDDHGQPVPIGVPGELYVGGAGVARGYLNRPDLTATRFVTHPFDGRPGSRLYRTGDRVRRLADGDLEYLGRVDHQVKLRGFRIELGEIQAALEQHPAIARALVVAQDTAEGQKRLVAYATARHEPPPADELRDMLKSRLPDYMVPAAFAFLGEFPLTPHGKVDVRALPEVGDERPALAAEYAAPVTPSEKALSDAWAGVLGLDRVGIHDNFFALGGDSILSIRVVSEAEKRGLHLSVSLLFQHQTVHELAAALDHAAPAAAQPAAYRPFDLIEEEDRRRLPADVEDAYPLTRLQAGMLFHGQYSPEAAMYCNLSSLHLRMPFDERRFCRALQEVIDRHAVLRTSFDLVGYSQPLQIVHRRVEAPLEVDDIRHLDRQAQEALLADWIERERVRGYEDWRAPLLRFHVHVRGDGDVQLTWREHHAILDGWSVAAMITEVIGRYRESFEPAAESAPAAPRFAEYVATERSALATEQTRRFWLAKLGDATPAILPREPHAAVPASRRFGQHEVAIAAGVSDALKQLSRSSGVPLKSVLLAAHLKAISMLAGTTDVLTGLIANARPESGGGDRVLGLFLNTLPLRQQLDGRSWAEVAREAFEREQEMLTHRAYPLAQIQQDTGGRELLETSFNYINFHVYEDIAGDVEVLDAIAFERTHFTLMATFGQDLLAEGSPVRLTLHYDAEALSDRQIQSIAQYYGRILSALAEEPNGRHDARCLLPDSEIERLVFEFNDTAADHDLNRCMHELFEAQALRSPDAPAIAGEEGELSYRELNERAEQLAAGLGAAGAGPESLVAICMDRGVDVVVAMLGVLKAGGAYVPIDPAYPAERVAFMLQDSRAGILLTQSHLVDRFPATDAKTVCLDREWPTERADRRPSSHSRPHPDNLAYVIYTSGSTGRPKGVCITHRSAVALLRWLQDVYTAEDLAGVLASTSVCFDLSVFEMFAPLSAGGCIILAADVLHWPPGELSRRVTLVNTVPSAMEELLRLDLVPDSVRTINLAGEPLTTDLVRRIHEHRPAARVFDLYGPSEDTTYSTWGLRDPEGPATIGRPIANTRIHVLDEGGHPAPQGVTGELYIGGDGLARGYLDRPELTAERFVPDHLGGSPGASLYRTGDLGRYLPDGRIEFLGRGDDQVKIRGFRIELGEIEACVRKHADIETTAVTIREDVPGDKRIVAYIVPRSGASPDASALRAWIARKLPAHMVPAHFVTMDALPRTPNGKLDRRRLPAPADMNVGRDASYVAPRDEEERLVATIWAEVLRVERVGRHDGFFELGGHSLIATQVISRLRQAVGMELPLRALFESPTVAGVADIIRAARWARSPRIGQDAIEVEREEIEL